MTIKKLPVAPLREALPAPSDAASVGRIRIQELGSSSRIPVAAPLQSASSKDLVLGGAPRAPGANAGEQRALPPKPVAPEREVGGPERGSSTRMPVSAPIAPADGRPLAARRSPKPGSGQYRAPVGGYSVPGRSAASGGELRAGPACFGALREHAFELVVVAASTGGPPALAEFVGALPADLPVPILVVQHMPAGFLETFAERLNGLTGLSVRVARGNELVSSSQIWFAPGGRHLTVEREARALRLRLTDSAPVNGCRPSADVMFESAAYATSGNLIAVVLSGIGRDGRDGSRRVRGLGGAVYVQTASSCAVSEMPEGVRRAHLSDGAFSPGELALQIERRVTENIHGN